MYLYWFGYCSFGYRTSNNFVSFCSRPSDWPNPIHLRGFQLCLLRRPLCLWLCCGGDPQCGGFNHLPQPLPCPRGRCWNGLRPLLLWAPEGRLHSVRGWTSPGLWGFVRVRRCHRPALLPSHMKNWILILLLFHFLIAIHHSRIWLHYIYHFSFFTTF